MQGNGHPSRGATLVYRLAEAVEQLCWFAEVQWTRDLEGATDLPDPDPVEAHLERVVQLADGLGRERVEADLRAALETFTVDLDLAWEEYQAAWGQPAHHAALRLWDDRHGRDGEFPDEVQKAIISSSPALRQFQQRVRDVFKRLASALPEPLRLLAEVGCRLVRPDYPGLDFERVVEEAGGSLLHYLQRDLRRQVEERWPDLLRHYPALERLRFPLGRCSEHRCLDSVSRFRRRLGKTLALAEKRVDDCSDAALTPQSPVEKSGQDVAAQEYPAQSRKGPRQCAMQAWQQYERATRELEEGCTDRQAYNWLRDKDTETKSDLPDFETWVRYLREMRLFLDMQKYTSRRGRTGAGIMHASEIEPPTPAGKRARRHGREELLDRLGDLAGDAIGKKPDDKVWEEITTTLTRLDVPQEEIETLVAAHKPDLLQTWVNRARTG